MKYSDKVVILLFFLCSCVEPYDFVIKDNKPMVVVEASISDKSFNETLAYPSDGRRFVLKLSYTSNVTNSRGQAIKGATVGVADNAGNTVYYYETTPGQYEIFDYDFKALPGRKYQLRITTPNDEKFESAWESLPEIEDQPIGTIGFHEEQKMLLRYEEKVPVLKNVDVAQVVINLPSHPTKPYYYKWDFSSNWIYIAPLSGRPTTRQCWATSDFYLNNYTVHEDYNGGYEKDLFFIETIDNDKIWEDFTVLIRQQILSNGHYFYLKEMQEQVQGGIASDKPPFNLTTNMMSLTEGRSVIGYFGIAKEQAFRWYFNSRDLSYPVINRGAETCRGIGPEPPPGCLDCMEYEGGVPTRTEPSWWRQ